jgi:hypothetical protein
MKGASHSGIHAWRKIQLTLCVCLFLRTEMKTDCLRSVFGICRSHVLSELLIILTDGFYGVPPSLVEL